MLTVTKPCPQEFRDDVVRVARNREPGVGLDQIVKDNELELLSDRGRVTKL